MEYNDTLKKIHSFERLGMKLGLDRMQKLLGLMGNPEKKLKFIHVAGTNGKGSVCTMLDLSWIRAATKPDFTLLRRL